MRSMPNVQNTLSIFASKQVSEITPRTLRSRQTRSLRSGDLSRQVGASIVTRKGCLVAVGANDVPRAGGGQYWGGEGDNRDHVRGYDSNESQRVKIARDIFNRVNNDEGEDFEKFLNKIKNSTLFDITEYGRAVHAEMEALLSCARSGISTQDTSLFSTTFPCHNCAKHIIDSGVERVVYVEPYPKSHALLLHHDAIEIEKPSSAEQDEKERERKIVRFEPYIGIGPRRYLDLFSMKLSSGKRLVRKKDGKLVDWKKEESLPRIPSSASMAELEKDAVSVLRKKMEEPDESKKEN